MRDVVRVDRREQAQHDDHEEQAAEDQRDLVAPQPAPGEPLGPEARGQLLAVDVEGGLEAGRELGAGSGSGRHQ